jgi:4-amino-4-deoxy-L-arabinose transferase-like glycosyltransferase
MRPLTAVACVAAIAGPWYGSVGARTGGQWLAGFLGVHNLGRFLHPMEHHRGPIFYYLIAVSIGFFPWSLFFAPTIARLRTQLAAAGARKPAYVFLCCWIVVYLGFFSLAATKLPNYIVPLYPALALLTAAWLEAWLSDPQITPSRKLRPAWIVLGLAGFGVAGGLPLAAKHFVDGPWTVGLIAIPLIAAAVLCWRLCEQGRVRQVAIVFCAAAVLFHSTLFGWAAVVVGRRQNSPQFAAAINRNSGGGEPVIRSFGYYRPSLVFYAKHPVWQLVEDEQVHRFFQEQPRDAFLVTTDERYERLAASLPSDVCVLERGRWFLRSKQILLLGRPQHLAQATSTLENSGWRSATEH